MDVMRFSLYLTICGLWLSTVTWFLDLQRCAIILTQFDANRWSGSLPIKQHRGRTAASVAVTQCYTLMQVLFVPGWSTVLLLFLANILESRSVVSVSKIGTESKWWNSSILIWLLLLYSIRPNGLLTLWWPARLLPWRLFLSLSTDRSSPDSGSLSGEDWLWPEQRNTERTVSKHQPCELPQWSGCVSHLFSVRCLSHRFTVRFVVVLECKDKCVRFFSRCL